MYVERGQHGLLSLRWNPPVDRRVTRTAEQTGCRVDQRQVGRVVAVGTADIFTIRLLRLSRHPERWWSSGMMRDHRNVQLEHRAQNADLLRVKHHLGRGHSGHEGVCALPSSAKTGGRKVNE